MRVRAFAKINLSLRVLGARSDGYHELRTVFQSIALHDTLTIRESAGPFALTCNDPQCPTDRRNLVWRAAEAVWKIAGRHAGSRGRRAPRGLSIHVSKRIPMDAGFGGGSSDAVAVIRALGREWRVAQGRQRAIAAALGADLPYFFEGGTALGLERGDLLFPLVDHPAAWVVLAIPAFGVSTKDAFSWLDAERSQRPGRDRRRGLTTTNDLQGPVSRRHPEIARLVRALERAGAMLAAMSGSGSGVFGLFSERAAAIRAAAALAALGTRRVGLNARVVVTRTVGRRAYERLAGN
jgi:4-diphosphocytidyl-2-C-methyl-D-erythritol kinase